MTTSFQTKCVSNAEKRAPLDGFRGDDDAVQRFGAEDEVGGAAAQQVLGGDAAARSRVVLAAQITGRVLRAQLVRLQLGPHQLA